MKEYITRKEFIIWFCVSFALHIFVVEMAYRMIPWDLFHHFGREIEALKAKP